METQKTSNKWKQTFIIVGVVFAIFVIQHYFRRFGQPIETIYFKILFNSIALTGTILLGLSYILGPLARLWPKKWTSKLELRMPLGIIGVGFITLHAFLALIILNPAYYSKMFAESGKLNTLGELSILFGVIGFITFIIIAITSLPQIAENMGRAAWKKVQKLGFWILGLSTLHFAILKWRGWFVWENWHNGIPSGTLVATTFILIVFLMHFLAYLKKQ